MKNKFGGMKVPPNFCDMKLFQNNIKVPVSKCKRPLFKSHRGRTWDSGTVKIDDNDVQVHLDTTWGQYIYFQYGDKKEWYKIKMWSDSISFLQEKGWDIDPFGETKLTTKII